MTEADLEREAVKLFKQLGLTVGAESLDFFQGESVFLTDWKSNFKTPHSRPNSYKLSSSRALRSKMSNSSSPPHNQMRVPLTVLRPTNDIGSEGSISVSPTSHESTDREEEVDKEEDEHFGKYCISR